MSYKCGWCDKEILPAEIEFYPELTPGHKIPKPHKKCFEEALKAMREYPPCPQSRNNKKIKEARKKL